MTEQSSRRPLLKRACLLATAVMLLLAWYLAGAPVVAVLVRDQFSSAFPVFVVAYYPVEAYRSGTLPGARLYASYCEWVDRSLSDEFARVFK